MLGNISDTLRAKAGGIQKWVGAKDNLGELRALVGSMPGTGATHKR